MVITPCFLGTHASPDIRPMNLYKPVHLLLIVLPIMIFLPSCHRHHQVAVEPGVSLQLAEHRSAVLSDIRYRLDFTIPQEPTAAIDGVVRLTFELSDTRLPLQLDFRAPEEHLKSVNVNGAAPDYRFTNEHIVIPAESLRAGENEIAIEFIAGEGSLNRNPDYLYTLFVPDRARTAFPVFDQPGLKSVYELTLTIPEGWEAMANGPLLEDQRDGAYRRLTFGESSRIPSYLFSFVAGKFERVTKTVNGRDMTLIHRETDAGKVSRNLDEIFRLHGTSLDWLEQYTGIPYPYQKFDFALIPGFQYSGMEHVGAILYRSDSLFLDEDPSQSSLLGRASLIAHETAHMWFGNLVTMEWFNDVWTKEVYANFMAARMVNPEFPEVDHDLNLLVRHYPAAYGVDRTEGANPIRQHLENLNMAGQMYGPIIYQKAPIMMRQLELLLGEALFRQGIREYLERFSHDNATWPELIAIFDRLGDQDLERWSDVWVHTAGRPHFAVEPGQSLRIRQDDPSGDNRIWTQQFEVLIFSGDERCAVDVTSDAPVVEVTLPPGCADLDHVLLNSDGMGYGLFEVDKALLAHWQDLTDLQKGVLLIDLYENMLEQREIQPLEMVRSLTRLIAEESNQLIVDLALDRLGTTYWSFLTDAQRSAQQAAIEEMLWAGVTHPDHDGSMKRILFRSYQYMAMSDQALDRLYAIWSGTKQVDGLTLSETDLIKLAAELSVKMPERFEQIAGTQLERITNPDRRREFEFIMPALSSEREVRDRFFESLMDVGNRSIESWVRTALEYLHHPLRVEESEQYLGASLEVLEELQVTGDIFFPSQWLNLTFRNYSTDSAVQTVRAFLDERPDYNEQLSMRVLQAADQLFRANRLRE
jgi:aminopeptidase N